MFVHVTLQPTGYKSYLKLAAAATVAEGHTSSKNRNTDKKNTIEIDTRKIGNQKQKKGREGDEQKIFPT